MTVAHVVTGRVHVACRGTLVLTGTACGGVVVTQGGYARITGHTEGLFVAVGGHAVLTGTCHGPAINDGGRLRVEGTIDGPLLHQAGETIITPNATVTDMTIRRQLPNTPPLTRQTSTPKAAIAGLR